MELLYNILQFHWQFNTGETYWGDMVLSRSLQIGKQWKPVQVFSFSRFTFRPNLANLLVGDSPQPPFERYRRYRLRILSERFLLGHFQK